MLYECLARRSRTAGTAPLLTWYAGAGSGERTELSGRTFANWADKTANLIVDELDLTEGDRVRLDVAAAHPGHWMTLVWVMAAWQAGLVVSDADDAELVVAGPDGLDGRDGGVRVACSLHPLALPLRDLPPGWRDFSSVALAQPDAWLGLSPGPEATAWDVSGRTLTQAELGELPGDGERRLLTPTGLWDAVTDGLIAPLLGGGSAVIVEGAADQAGLESIAGAEGAQR